MALRASLLRSLTETAPKIFGDLGFTPVSQREVPSEVQKIRSYRDVDPGTVDVLRLELETRI